MEPTFIRRQANKNEPQAEKSHGDSLGDGSQQCSAKRESVVF